MPVTVESLTSDVLVEPDASDGEPRQQTTRQQPEDAERIRAILARHAHDARRTAAEGFDD